MTGTSQAEPSSLTRLSRYRAIGLFGDAGPFHEQAAQVFADELAAVRVPSVRAIRAQLHVGQRRAQRIRGYLASLNGA
ncbi:MAG TPA: hypothetical protein VHU91_01685 [Mycobacteriales bacterium]|nr:hypothetical protein [Mycobacteriales bacterium]